MKTLAKSLLRLQTLRSQGVITDAEYAQVMAERRSRMVNSRGRLVDEVVQRSVSRSVKHWDGKPAPEVQTRDMQIAYDRERVAMGMRSALVRVVKAKRDAVPATDSPIMAQIRKVMGMVEPATSG